MDDGDKCCFCRIRQTVYLIFFGDHKYKVEPSVNGKRDSRVVLDIPSPCKVKKQKRSWRRGFWTKLQEVY